jgi:hypothetical protein
MVQKSRNNKPRQSYYYIFSVQLIYIGEFIYNLLYSSKPNFNAPILRIVPI